MNTSELRVIEDMGLGDIAEAAEKIIREGINTSKSIVSEKNRSVAVTTKKGTEAIVSGDQSVAISKSKHFLQAQERGICRMQRNVT